MTATNPPQSEPRWSREDVQRVLYHIIRRYEQANMTRHGKLTRWRRRAVLGGDSELLRDAIRTGRETLRDNDWWRDDPAPKGREMRCRVTHAPGGHYVCWAHHKFLPWSMAWCEVGCCCDSDPSLPRAAR